MNLIRRLLRERTKVRVKINIPDFETLCTSCRHAMVTKLKNGEVYVFCSGTFEGVKISGAVDECSAYRNKNLPTLNDFEEIAWTLNTNAKKVVGFSPPKKEKTYLNDPFD